MTCPNCGGSLSGDGFTDVLHCENVDVIGEGYEPDAAPVYCDSQPGQQAPIKPL